MNLRRSIGTFMAIAALSASAWAAGGMAQARDGRWPVGVDTPGVRLAVSGARPSEDHRRVVQQPQPIRLHRSTAMEPRETRQLAWERQPLQVQAVPPQVVRVPVATGRQAHADVVAIPQRWSRQHRTLIVETLQPGQDGNWGNN